MKVIRMCNFLLILYVASAYLHILLVLLKMNPIIYHFPMSIKTIQCEITIELQYNTDYACIEFVISGTLETTE